MKHKTDKNHFDHQYHHVHFLWASNRGQQVYDMRIVQDNKKLGFEKNLSFENNGVFLKRPLSFQKIWLLKNVLKSRKNLGFYKEKNYRYENKTNKTPNLK